jgi:AraC-like DNA-binding protein
MRMPAAPAIDPLKRLIEPMHLPGADTGIVAGAFTQDEFDIDAPWHHHEMHQLQYAFEGSIEVEDKARRNLLPRTLAAWIPAGVTHRTSLHRVRSGSILFAPDMVKNAGDRVRIVMVSSLMREMVIGAMRWQIGAPLDTVGSAYFKTLALLCGEWIEKEAPLSLPSSDDPALRAAMDHTRAQLITATIASASAAANLSERSLRRRFQSNTGLSWEDYRRRARLLLALERITATRLPIGQIAMDLGYESQSAFAKAFRSLLGVNPSAFRRNC